MFDHSCDPVQINGTGQNCLLWSDNLFGVGQSAEGLQNSIKPLVGFYRSIGLQLNSTKSKVMIYNNAIKVLKATSSS